VLVLGDGARPPISIHVSRVTKPGDTAVDRGVRRRKNCVSCSIDDGLVDFLVETKIREPFTALEPPHHLVVKCAQVRQALGGHHRASLRASKPLQCAEHVDGMIHIGTCERRNNRAPIGQQHQDAFGRQHLVGFAERSAGYIEALAQQALADGLSRTEFPGDDKFTDLVGHPLGHGATREFRRCQGKATTCSAKCAAPPVDSRIECILLGTAHQIGRFLIDMPIIAFNHPFMSQASMSSGLQRYRRVSRGRERLAGSKREHTMVQITRRNALLGTAATLALPAGTAVGQAAQKLRFGHTLPGTDAWQKAALKFAELVKDGSRGALEVQVFSNGVLGNDPTLINSVRGGTLDICVAGNPFFTGLSPKLNALDLPFLFKDRKHIVAVLEGPIGDELRNDLAGSSLKALATWEVGWRNVTNSKRPVRTPDDLKGLKIRTTPNPAHIKAFQLLGAVPTPMAFTELFTALETGAVDGQENPTTLILSAKFFEVQKHLSLTQHAFTTAPLVMNKAKFEGLSTELQDVLVKSAKQAAVLQREMNVANESSSLAELKTKGMQAVEQVDRDTFRKIVADEVRKEFSVKHGAELPDRIAAAG
jgi:TRAP-type transport system periplasmic protein